MSVSLPQVSVIIPAYNVENYIELSVQSVLAQDYDNLELIVIDDGSTDDTLSVVEKACGRPGSSRVIHTDNRGVSAARNTALDICSGDYVYFVDADDWLPQGSINRLVKVAIRDSADVVLTRAGFCFPNGTSTIQAVRSVASDDLNHFGPVSCGLPTFIWNYLFSKRAIGNHRFNERLRVQEDTDFILSVCKPGLRYTLCDDITYYYRANRSGSALSELDIEGCLQAKLVRKRALLECDECAPGYRASEDYGVACFGVLRRLATDKNRYYEEVRLSSSIKRSLSLCRNIKVQLVRAAERYPRLMRPLFMALGLF